MSALNRATNNPLKRLLHNLYGGPHCHRLHEQGSLPRMFVVFLFILFYPNLWPFSGGEGQCDSMAVLLTLFTPSVGVFDSFLIYLFIFT
jgi:hypothetical protein